MPGALHLPVPVARVAGHAVVQVPVSQGLLFIEDKIAVFDEFLFKHTLSRYDYNLDVLFTNIENDSYIPDMSDAICYNDYTQEYAGYEITYPGLVKKS